MFSLSNHTTISSTGLKVIIFLVAFFNQACIDPVTLQVTDEEGILVVDGLITNEPGPYQVKLSMSGRLDQFGGAAVAQAEVVISDDQGKLERLAEISPGLYQTDPSGIQGTVGRSYTLTILLPNGEKYISLPELLQPVPDIDEIYFEQVFWKDFYNPNTNLEVERDGFQVYIELRNPSERGNFYMWKTRGIVEYYTYTPDDADPLTFCCNICYETKSRFDEEIVLADDQYFTSSVKWKQPVVLINNLQGVYRTYVKVSQYALSFRAYDFWKQIQQQRSSVGSIFDPPPSEIKGNIIAEDDSKAALGFFGASSVATRHIMIQNNRYPSQKEFARSGDCREIYSESTSVRPPEFE